MLWQSNTRSPLTFALSAVILKAGGKIFFFSVYPRRCFFLFRSKIRNAIFVIVKQSLRRVRKLTKVLLNYF